MKIVTIGISPYNLVSHGKIHSWIIQYLYLKNHSLSSLVWFHDINFYAPNEYNQFYYKFNYLDTSHQIPITPFSKTHNEPVIIYETLNRLQPDLVITIGDLSDFYFMKAVKSFCANSFKWLFVLLGAPTPISESNAEIISDADAIFCTCPSTHQSIKPLFQKELIDWKYVGAKIQNPTEKPTDKFRIMALGKNIQSDNLATTMEVCAQLKYDLIPSLELYVHTNVHEHGEINLNLLKERFDPNNTFLKFPEKYVSFSDGISQDELNQEYANSHVFVSIPLSSSTSLTVFEAMSLNCFPILASHGSNQDILQEFTDIEHQFDMSVPVVPFMTTGETYLYIAKPDDLRRAVYSYYVHYKNKGCQMDFQQFTQKFNRKDFLNKVLNIVERLKDEKTVVCLDY